MGLRTIHDQVNQAATSLDNALSGIAQVRNLLTTAMMSNPTPSARAAIQSALNHLSGVDNAVRSARL